MPLTLKECTDESTFSRLIDCEWSAYYNPYHPYMQILFPVFGARPSDRLASIQESKYRQWSWHTSDPTSHWFYVEDEEKGEVLGAAQWLVHDAGNNPFEKGNEEEALEAYWWPEGEGRRFATSMLEQVYGGRRERMRRPHMLCNIMFTHPRHRRRGVGKLLMTWGMDRAKEKGLEVFIEGTDPGRPLYESFGLRVMYVGHLDAYEMAPSDEWRKLEREILPLHWYFMWKPREGVYEKRVTEVPWESGS